MRHFCLMTSENYIAKSITMYGSLIKYYGSDFTLYYFCFDDITYKYLLRAKYKNIIPISLKDWEDPELLKIKSTRTKTEYFFTTTGSLILYVFKKFNVDICTYLDADLYFYDSPEILIREMTNKSVMITEHRYSNPSLSEIYGKYCIQFMPVRNDENGNRILSWWRNACIQWCYLKSENGLWADQGYLTDWPTRFQGVHELQHLGGGVAPWNASQYKFSRNSEGKLFLTEKLTKIKSDLVFFHFHGVRFFSNNHIYFENQSSDKVLMKYLYRSYLNQLIRIAQEIKSVDNSIEPLGIIQAPPFTWKKPFQYLKRKLTNRLITNLKFN